MRWSVCLCVCAPASSRGRSRAARETGKRDQIAPSFGFCEREKGRGGRREGPKKSVHEIASDRGLVGKRRNQREPWSARLRDRRGDDVERQHGAWGRKKGQRRRGSSHTLHRPPPLFWTLLHSTLPASPPAAQQQPTGGGRCWGFLLAAVDSFLWASVLCRISQLAQARLDEITTSVNQCRESRHGAAVFRIPSMDSMAPYLSVFFCFGLPSSQPRLPASASRLLLLGSLAPQLVSARCYCHKPAAATARRGPARGGRGREPGPGESTWDVHRCPAHCTACDAGGPSEAGRRHEQRDFCVDLTPASPVSKAPTWGRLGPVLLTVLIDRIQLALRLTSLVTI